MTILGSDASYKSGGPQIQLQEDAQKTADKLVNTRALLISKDSVNDPLAMQMMISTDENKKTSHFQSQASKPTLTPMAYVRLGLPPETPPNELWMARYEQLIQNLPEDARNRLGAENSRPFDQRNFLYTGLDNLLRMSAKLLVRLDYAAEPIPPNSAAADMYEIYSLTPYVQLKGANMNGNDMLNAYNKTLEFMGRNSPEFDPLNDEAMEFSEYLTRFSSIAERATTGQASKADIAQINTLASSIQDKVTLLQGRDQGGATSAFLPQYKTMQLVLNAFSAPTNISPAFVMSLGTSQIGLEGNTQSSGLIGNALSKSMNQTILGSGRTHAFTEDLIIKALLTTAGAGVSFLSANGLGMSPEKGENEVSASKFNDLQIVLHMALSTGAFDTVTEQIASAIELSEKDKEYFKAKVFVALLLTTTILAGEGKTDRQAAIILTLEKFIKPYFQNMIAEADQKEIHDEEGNPAQAVLLQQSWTAFEAGNFEELASLIQEAMKELGGTDEATKDLDHFHAAAQQLAQGVQAGMQDKNTNLPDVAIAV